MILKNAYLRSMQNRELQIPAKHKLKIYSFKFTIKWLLSCPDPKNKDVVYQNHFMTK